MIFINIKHFGVFKYTIEDLLKAMESNELAGKTIVKTWIAADEEDRTPASGNLVHGKDGSTREYKSTGYDLL